MGCSPVSPACDNCYAARMTHRLAANIKIPPYFFGLTDAGGKWTGRINLHAHLMKQVLRWQKPRRIFVGSMTDLFHENVPDEFLDQVFAYVALAPRHTFLILTKRPKRMRRYFTRFSRRHHTQVLERAAMAMFGEDAANAVGNALDEVLAEGHNVGWPMRNLWLGITAEDQQRADERIPILLDTPAAKRFVSIEPMLGAIDLRPWLPGPCQHPQCDGGSIPVGNDGGRPCPWCECGPLDRLDWVICGGESGPNARPMHPDWARSLRDQCAQAGVPYLFKQWGEWMPCSAMDDEEEAPGGAPWGYIGDDGIFDPGEDGVFSCRNGVKDEQTFRVGKHRAGRLLDGVEHNAFPEVRP